MYFTVLFFCVSSLPSEHTEKNARERISVSTEHLGRFKAFKDIWSNGVNFCLPWCLGFSWSFVGLDNPLPRMLARHHQDDITIFRIGNPELNLYVWRLQPGSWEYPIYLHLFCEAWLEGEPQSPLQKERVVKEIHLYSDSPIIHGFLLENGGITLKGYDSIGDTPIVHEKKHDLWEEGSISEWQIHQVWCFFFPRFFQFGPKAYYKKKLDL